MTPLGQLRPPDHDPDEVDRLIGDILSRSEFQPAEQSWLRRQWERFVNWLSSLGDDSSAPPEILDAPTGGAEGGGPGSLVAYLLLALVLALAVWVVIRVVRARRAGRVDDDTDDDAGVDVEIEQHRTASDWRSRALAFEADEDWREAVRAWLRWGIRTMVDRGVLEDVPGRTTGEYRRYVRDRYPELEVDFDRASRLFDEVWYADRAASSESVATVRTHIESFVEQAPARGDAGRPATERPMAEIS